MTTEAEVEHKVSTLVVEFFHNRAVRLHQLELTLAERMRLQRYHRVDDTRTRIGGAVLTLTATRRNRDLGHWQLWLVPEKVLLHWMNGQGGDTMWLGGEILRIMELQEAENGKKRVGHLQPAYTFESLDALFGAFGNTVTLRNREFGERLWGRKGTEDEQTN